MADYTGKAQFCWTIKCPAEHEVEGDRNFARHAEWMERTHPREGEQALLQYTVSKSHDEDGNAYFRLVEVYESQAGVDNHREMGHRNQEDWAADFAGWLERCEVIDWTGDAKVVRSLW